MKLLKAITVWSSILLFLTSCSTGTVTLNKPSAETNGSLLEMPTPMFLGDDVKYSEIEEEEDRLRVLLQEYAYWLIYTSWDLREPYGPQEAEWSIFNSAELNDKLPESYQLYNNVIPKVMTSPSIETLESFID